MPWNHTLWKMAGRSTLNVSLTRELEKFVEERVNSGRYQTASEVVREGLRLLEEREHARQTALDEVRRLVATGIEQADRGEFVDGEDVFEELKKLSAQRREAKLS
jgi:antitoxin ParD1/3/4